MVWQVFQQHKVYSGPAYGEHFHIPRNRLPKMPLDKIDVAGQA
jgi:hypothetical protein